MGDKTGIEWTDCTFNPWIGCQGVSSACDHCYAKTLVERWGGDFATRRRTAPANWNKVMSWEKKARLSGVKTKVFCASLADVFDNQVEPEWRADLFRLIAATPNLIWQLLTKRPQNIAKMLPANWGDGYPNVWLGTTAEDNVEYRRRWPHLRAITCKTRFLSYEPTLGSLGEVEMFLLGSPDWVICGGESGPHARPMRPDWPRTLRDQCAAAGVPFFFKQWGEWLPGTWSDEETDGALFYPASGGPSPKLSPQSAWADRVHWFDAEIAPCGPGAIRIGKKSAGALLDGIEHKEFPA